MDYPKISLVTVCFNHEKYIGETIESVLSQNYPNLQYIVIDDGSTDDSWKVIEKYKDRLYHCEQMHGYRKFPTIALNRGIEMTDGEIMGWLNSDDILLPNSLFSIAKIFQDNQQVEWFTGLASAINFRSELILAQFRPKNIYDYLSGDWSVIQQESTFWRRNLWNKAGGKLIVRWAFDTELWTHFFKYTEHYNSTVPLGAFRKGQQSLSVHNPDVFIKPTLESLKRMRQEANLKLKIGSLLYKIFKIAWPIFYLIPNKLYARLPFLNKFCYKIIEYNFAEDRWKTRLINPFKIRII